MADNWQYSDYITMTRSARLTRLRLHIKEVSDRVRESVSGDGQSMSTSDLRSYLSELKAEERDLTIEVNAASGARRPFVGMRVRRRR